MRWSLFQSIYSKKCFSLFSLRNFNRCNKRGWIRDRRSYLSSRLFLCPVPPGRNCLLHSSPVSTWKFFHSRKKRKHRQHCPDSKNRLVACERWRRQLRYHKDKILLPHSKAEMSKRRISRAGCCCFIFVQCKPQIFSISTRSEGSWGTSTVKGIWKSGTVCCVGP